ncbi:hypothetical protein [Caudoviricetes sp.]|nr:hypothetical protein [Caudoviricetes sp.]UOF79688.1 hypothetical protein [Caudoviricetes sp.]UOF79838.1 hypothetical protein [Bacteriophage sp.]UOF81359.1 hypothetical protein [Caudoviricetes sp.]
MPLTDSQDTKDLPEPTSRVSVRTLSNTQRDIAVGKRPGEPEPSFPISRHKLRQAILAKAGLTLEHLGEAVSLAFKRNLQLLDATKEVHLVLGDGEVLKREVPDNLARQRAVDAIYDIGGVVPKEDVKGPSGPLIVLQLPEYYDPKFVAETTPKIVEGTVVESTAPDPE